MQECFGRNPKTTNRPVIVNGAQYGVATYPMFGSDYGVKLRDAATMLNGTRLLFSQNWNGEKNSVFLERGPYQLVGGEMQPGGGSEKELTYSEHQFYLDNDYFGIEAFLLDDDNYVFLNMLSYLDSGVPAVKNTDGIMEIDTEAPPFERY